MWKRFDEQAALSRRIAALSDRAFRVWVMLMPQTDVAGRFVADPVAVWTRCFPRGPLNADQVEEALAELAEKGSVHMYEEGDEKYLVYHDHAQFNPSKHLKNQRPRHPAPPEDLCRCTGRDGTNTNTGRDGTVATPLPRRSHAEGTPNGDEKERPHFGFSRPRKIRCTCPCRCDTQPCKGTCPCRCGARETA